MLGGVICTARGAGAATLGAACGLSVTCAVIAVVGPVNAGRSMSGGGTVGIIDLPPPPPPPEDLKEPPPPAY